MGGWQGGISQRIGIVDRLHLLMIRTAKETECLHDPEGEDPLRSGVEGTVCFGLDSAEYEIDLNAAHSQELHTSLRAYITHVLKIGGARRISRGAHRNAGAVDTRAVCA